MNKVHVGWQISKFRVISFKSLIKINCFVLSFSLSFHQLPYGTMQDDEMRKLSVPILQDEGYIFLWVTGRYTTAKIDYVLSVTETKIHKFEEKCQIYHS